MEKGKTWKESKYLSNKLISDHLLGADLSSCAAGSWRPDVLVLVVQHLQEYCGYWKQHLVKYYCYCYCKQHPPHHYLKCYCFCYCKQHFKSVRERIITLQSTITASRRSWAVRVGHRWVETWSVFFFATQTSDQEKYLVLGWRNLWKVQYINFHDFASLWQKWKQNFYDFDKKDGKYFKPTFDGAVFWKPFIPLSLWLTIFSKGELSKKVIFSKRVISYSCIMHLSQHYKILLFRQLALTRMARESPHCSKADPGLLPPQL